MRIRSLSPHPTITNLLLLAAVFLLMVLPRWLVVEQTATADEAKWVARAANFSTALSSASTGSATPELVNGEQVDGSAGSPPPELVEGELAERLANTYQSEHPGVTTMWAGALGLKALFPNYAELSRAANDPGQLEPYELDQFLLARGYTPLQALVAGRRVMVLFNALALTLLFLYARRLLDVQTALLAAVFSALSPFFVAHTHLMHLDGLAGSLMVLSLMAFLSFADRRKALDLLLSGAAAGLAWLTKTPAFVLAPILLAITLLLIWSNRKDGTAAVRLSASKSARGLLLSLLGWAAVALFTFILFWPAMWVEPINTLNRIFVQALGYAGGGHGDPVFFNGTIYSDGRIPASVFYFYPLTYLWRSTPLVLLGLVLAIPAFWRRWSPLDRRAARSTILALLLYALLFTLFMTLGSKKFDRYLIPVYPALHLVSAAGWVGLARWAARRWFTKTSEVSSQPPVTAASSKTSEVWMVILVVVLLAAGQFLALRSVFPYPLSYYNPIMGGSQRAPQVMQIGWGEGLDAAGQYLSEKPGGERLTVASWYRSVLAYHFDGDTVSIKADTTVEELEGPGAADYAVLYIHQWQRDAPPALLEEFASRIPEHIIKINGLEYARIYELRP